jgi:chorismate mutase / prephenate dehydratase
LISRHSDFSTVRASAANKIMMSTPSDLKDLRRRLDAIDDGLHDLLVDRAEIVSLVAEHKRSSNSAFYQPEREAEIIRRLVARHRGPLPVASLVRIWREILSATVSLEAPFAVAVYQPAAAPGFWDLARDHYGSTIPIATYGSVGQVIRAVAGEPNAAGVLPIPQEGEPDPWWRHLLAEDGATPKVVARLPFGPPGNARAAGAEALVIGHGAQRNTGRDRTLVATETSGISRARILGLLAALGLPCTFFASCEQVDGAVDLIELDSFVPPTDSRLERLRTELGAALHRLLPLGGYAVPLPLAPAVAAPVAAFVARG